MLPAGTACDDDLVLGTDPQPASMDGYVETKAGRRRGLQIYNRPAGPYRNRPTARTPMASAFSRVRTRRFRRLSNASVRERLVGTTGPQR
jgi:hypothetical protein